MRLPKWLTVAALATVMGCAAPQYRIEIQAPIQRPEMANMTIIIQR